MKWLKFKNRNFDVHFIDRLLKHSMNDKFDRLI